ncbi:MAG: hypothetical protein KGL31_05310 [candidate division NC10 bacterium]|nr:hypothetical protein [candidate division NC10 bacterium]
MLASLRSAVLGGFASLLFAGFLLLAWAPSVGATLYCNRPDFELTPNSGPPFDSVGFLNNGCTAFLIDRDHIAAAAHCFVDATMATGAWQTGLRFYPKFHPNRVVSDRKHVPRGDVARAVVGSRVSGGGMSDGIDWGIAKIDKWSDVAGTNQTLIPLAKSIPPLGAPLVNAAYTRAHFPFNAPDMVWDTTTCGWVGETAPGKNDGGAWAIYRHPAPLYDGVHEDIVGCNSRWMAGTIHTNCSLNKDDHALLIHNCDTIGGSSGSPLFHKNSLGDWEVIGLINGGGTDATKSANDFSLKTPACAQDTPQNTDNIGPSVERFGDAPRFASSVAVGRSPYSPSMTAVFAVDADRNRVVWRVRQGDTPSYKGTFSYWLDIGSPVPGVALTKVATCSLDPGGHPQVFVIAAGSIYTLSPEPSGKWGSWTHISPPVQGLHFLDVDALSLSGNQCQLYAVGEDGVVFTRTAVPGGATGSWSLVKPGSFRSISVLTYADKRWLTMVDAAGDLWRIASVGSGWSDAVKLSRPPGVTGWIDADMTWDEATRGFLVAIPKGGGNRLWFMPMYGDKAWMEWRYFDTHLWAPNAKKPQDAPRFETVTASRWMEDTPWVTSPVIFTTDNYGNVYFIEYTRVGTPRWVLDWKSFYHEFIPY